MAARAKDGCTVFPIERLSRHARYLFADEHASVSVSAADPLAPESRHVTHDGAVFEQSRTDPECFAVLFDRYAAECHRYVARRLDASVADDLVSEAFLIAFRKRAQFDTARRDARPWLYGIVTRLVDQHRRREARKYRALARTGAGPVGNGHEERVTERVDAQHVQRALGRVLARLAPRDRDVLLLYAWQEFPYADIAEALDIPVGTVRSRLNRVRRKLRTELDESDTHLIREAARHE